MPSTRGHERPFSNNSTTASVPRSHASTTITTPPKASWRALFFFTTKANIPMIVTGIFLSLAAGAVSPANAYLTGRVFDGFALYAGGKSTKEQIFHDEKKYITYIVALAGGSWLFHSLQLMCWLAFGELQAKNTRDRLFHGLLKKDLEWYDLRKNGIGALLPRLQTQIRDLQLATAQPLGSLFALGSTAVLSIAQAFYRSWDLTLVTLATSPIIILAMMWLGNSMQRLLTKQQEKLNEAQKFSTNALTSIETVKCFNGQEAEYEKYILRTRLAAHVYYRVVNSAALQMAFLVLLSVSMFVQGFYYGGVLISRGKKDSSDVVTTFLSAIGAFQAIQAFLPQLIVLEKGRTAGTTLRAIMAEVQGDKDGRRLRCGLLVPATCHGDIDVRDLSFSYPSRPERLALDHVTMHIPNGETTFLIGRSGSGKSTLGQLLMRFYSSQSGIISIDGCPLESLDVNWLRSNITLVEQQSPLFNETVFCNIALGKKDHESVTRAEVKSAAEFALLQHMISDLPEGLDTALGHKGGTLSGGQRQRMALARARLRDPPILILDESTSALDQISRTLMMDAIRQWRRGKTTIIITHDISHILPADYLYLLENGSIVQEGYRQNLEKMKNTPFQGFLPEELRADFSPFDARKRTIFDSEQTASTSNAPIPIADIFERVPSDPIEAHLIAVENKRSSFAIAFAGEGTPATGMVGFGKVAASPWMRMAVPTTRSPNESTRTSQNDDESSIAPSERQDSNRSLTQNLYQLVDKTGKVAADTRLNLIRGRRGRVNARGEIKLDEQNEVKKVVQQSLDSSKTLIQIMSTIWPSIDHPARLLVVIGFWGASIHAAGTPVFAYILSKLLQTYAVPGGDKHKALIYSMAILAVAFTDAVHTYVFRFFLECAAQCWVDNVRAQAIKRVLDQPESFFDKDDNSVSRLTNCLDRNAEEMRNLLGRFAPLAYVATLITLISILWAVSVSWKMTLIAVSVAPYIFGVSKAFAAVSGKWERVSNDASETASTIFTETFTNIKTVRALTLESHFSSKYIAATNNALVVGFQRSFYSGFFYGISDSAAAFATALVFYIGAWLVSSQGTDVAGVIQVFVMLMFAIQQVGDILEYIPQIGSAKDTASRLLRLSKLSRNSHEDTGDTRLSRVGSIIFDDFSFAYPSRPNQLVLRNITLQIRPGTSTAIVGGSGSGKSTIANLLVGIYGAPSTPNQQAGKLIISGRDITQISTSSLRALIVPVSQTPTLFAASISDNIAYGLSLSSPYNNQLSIRAAAENAGIHDFITSLPAGYATPIGDGGIGLSGGQAQRIAIARALVRNPAVLILDEATSALDVESALLIRSTLKRLVRERKREMTLVIITHDREMMEVAENVVVLDQGRVVETGGFEELLASRGALANLVSGGQWNPGEQQSPSLHRAGVKLRVVDWNPRTRKGELHHL